MFGTQVAGRADARADAGHPHRRRGRRLHPPLRRQPLPGRPRLRRRRPRPRLLPPRRPADRHRRQRDARPDPARPLPGRVRPATATSRSTPRSVRDALRRASPSEIAAATGDDRSPEEVAEGFLDDRRRQHGQRGQEDLRAERPRRHPLRAHHASAAPAASTPARSPTPSASTRCSCRRWPACSPRSASASPTPPRCASSPSRRSSTRTALARVREAVRASSGRPDPRANCSPTASPTTAISTVSPGAHLRYAGTDTAARRRRWTPRRAMTAAFDRPTAHATPSSWTGRSSSRRSRSRRSDAPGSQPAPSRTPSEQPAPAGGRARAPARDGAGCTRRRPWQRRRPAPPATRTAPRRTRVDRPADHRRGQRDHRRRPRLAGRPSATAAICCSTRVRPARRPVGGRHRGRPRHAGDLQQPLHVHRRADGRAPGEHRPVRQHQGAAGLLLRPVRPRRQPHRQRPAHPGAPRLDGRVHQGGAPAQRGTRCGPATCTPSTTRTTAAPTCPTSPSSPRSSTSAERDGLLFLVASRGHHAEIGGITPGSMPAFSRTVEEEGVLFDNWLLVETARSARRRPARCSPARPYPSRDPDDQPRRPARPDRRQREGRRGAAAR